MTKLDLLKGKIRIVAKNLGIKSFMLETNEVFFRNIIYVSIPVNSDVSVYKLLEKLKKECRKFAVVIGGKPFRNDSSFGVRV